MDEKTVQAIKQLQRRGKTNLEIAETLGVSKYTITYYCQKEGPKKKNQQRRAEAEKLLKQGMKIYEVADCLGIAKSTMYLWFAKDKDVKRSRKSRPKTCCPVCGGMFEPHNRAQKYCSPKCSRKANKTTSNHIRRLRKEHQTIDKDITLEGLYRRDLGFCYICGMKCNFEDYVVRNGRKIVGDWYPTMDHIAPLSNGGSHSWGNVKLAHKRCNTLKGARD